MKRSLIRAALLIAIAVFAAGPSVRAQQQQQKKSEPDPQESSSRKPQQAASSADDLEEPPDPKTKANPGAGASFNTNSNYDPFPAVHNVDVGKYYLNKGDIDAAIDRFQDAIRLRSNYALPRLLLGEAYEKKGDKSLALKYYKEYLEVFPTAPDSKKVHRKIEKLSKD